MDFAAFYRSDSEVWRVVGAVGYGNRAQLGKLANYDNQLSGSLSFRNELGFNITIASGVATATDSKKDNLSFAYGKVGLRSTFLPNVGETALSVDWGRTYNKDRNNDVSNIVGAQIAQDIDLIDVELYALVRKASLVRPGKDFSDVLVSMVGARLDF